MPSLRAIFFFAATAFATLASAQPLGTTPNPAGVVDLANPAALKVREPTHTLFARQDPSEDLEECEPQLSLCEILVEVETKVNVVSDKLTAMVSTQVDVKVVVDLVTQVKVILSDSIVDIKALWDEPAEFVLSLNGKVLTVVELSSLLMGVLTTICATLSCALRVVGTASFEIVFPPIIDVGTVLAQVLSANFRLIDGLYVNMSPTLNTIIHLCAALRLDAVVDVLNGRY